jgi:hypothetical protein
MLTLATVLEICLAALAPPRRPISLEVTPDHQHLTDSWNGCDTYLLLQRPAQGQDNDEKGGDSRQLEAVQYQRHSAQRR